MGCPAPLLCLGPAVSSQKGRSDLTCPLPIHYPAFPACLLLRATLTFAVSDVGGPIKIGAGVARTGDTMVLAKLGLIGAHRTADAPVGGGVVVVAGGAVHCRGHVGGVLTGKWNPCAPKTLLTKGPLRLIFLTIMG